MFLKKVASSACNSRNCAVSLETISALPRACGPQASCHPQNGVKRCVSKGRELVKLTMSCFIKDSPGSDSCDLVGGLQLDTTACSAKGAILPTTAFAPSGQMATQ